MAENLHIKILNRIGLIIIDHPERWNALNLRLWQKLLDALRLLGDKKDIRVVILRGVGEKAFCTGIDINGLQVILEDTEAVMRYLNLIEDVMSTIETMPKPVIAMLNGAALGGGCELAVACDLRIAADHARLGIPARRLGIVISSQDTKRLTAIAGPVLAKEMLFTGRILDAGEALRYGLVNRLASSAELEKVTLDLAGEMADSATLTLKSAKMIINDVIKGKEISDRQVGLEPAFQSWISDDFREGVRAFFEKRKPVFR